MARAPWSSLVVLLALTAAADELPQVEHQPSPCTVPDKPFTLCSRVSDDVQVAKVRVYFRRAGETWYAFVDGAFDGVNFCATLPAPRGGKTPLVEYYVQAIDSSFQAARSPLYALRVQSEEQCGFAPVERDPARAASLVVFATNQKQKRLSDGFVETGVRFVPVAAPK